MPFTKRVFYNGIGTISLAVAKRNGIKNAKFVVGKAEEQFAKWQVACLKPDVVIVDPPRKGLAESLIEATGKMGPQKDIYVSCNPATLVRDIRRLGPTAWSSRFSRSTSSHRRRMLRA